MKKDKKLTFKYLDEIKRLDDFFNYSDTLKNKYISQFFSVYSYLLEQNQIIEELLEVTSQIIQKPINSPLQQKKLKSMRMKLSSMREIVFQVFQQLYQHLVVLLWRQQFQQILHNIMVIC